MDSQLLSPKASELKQITLHISDTAESYVESDPSSKTDKRLLKVQIETLKSKILLLKKLQNQLFSQKMIKNAESIIAELIYVKNNVLLKKHWLREELEKSKTMKIDKLKEIESMEKNVEKTSLKFDNAIKKKGLDKEKLYSGISGIRPGSGYRGNKMGNAKAR